MRPLLTGVILLPITTLMFFFGDAISRLFVNDPEVIQYGRDLFRIISPSVFAFGFVMVLFSAFADDIVWFNSWEEITELLLIVAVGLVLYSFKRRLFEREGERT